MPFKPFYKFSYNDDFFIRNNINKLIPDGEVLTQWFSGFELNDTKTFELLFKNTCIIINHGLPTGIELMIEGKSNEIAHLEFMLSCNTSQVIHDALNYSQSEFDKWKIIFIGYLLELWFTSLEKLKMDIYSVRFLSPLSICHSDKIKSLFEQGNMDDKITLFLQQGKLDLNYTKQLIAKMNMYDINDAFYTVFNPHPFIDYGLAMDAINHYRQLKNVKGNKLAAILITVYFPLSSIKEAMAVL